jgi:hypothetical protein
MSELRRRLQRAAPLIRRSGRLVANKFEVARYGVYSGYDG